MKKFIELGDKVIKTQNIREISRHDYGNSPIFKKNYKICSYDIFIYYDKEEDINITYEDKKTRDKYYNNLKKVLCD